MASLTTVDQVQYYFSPNSIVAISDHNPSTRSAVTCVYGLSMRAFLPIQESVQEFLSRLNIAANFVQLTGPSEVLYWINTSSAVSVCPPAMGAPVGTNAVVWAGSTNFFVTEAPAKAASLLKLT